MDHQRWKEIDAVFDRMLEIDPGDRSDALAQMCVGDDDLRRRVEALLRQEASAEDFLKSSAIIGLAGQVARGLGALTPGQRIGHYEIKERIGAGGMGEVWRAWDKNLDRDVAIKILPPEFSADADRVQRFEREARTISKLNHSNIITIHDIVNVVDEADGMRFIVTELVEGRTLRERLNDSLGAHAASRAELSSGAVEFESRKRGRARSQVGWREAVLIATQIADALKAVHLVEVIHRDIKPENVMIQADGPVKLLDFGIAKPAIIPAGGVDASQPLAGMQTRLGATPGTLRYMSPEQARGEHLDVRTDVFSLGLVLYEMIAGRHPYAGKSDEEIIEALKSEDEIPPVAKAHADIPAALDRIVTKALRKKHEERHSSGGEMLADLERLKTLIEVKSEKEEGQALRAQNADQLLTQFVVFHDADRKTRIPLDAMWTIRRYAELKRGKLERELIRKSLISGLVSAGWKILLTAVVVAAITTLAAAWVSVSETWEERILRDGHTAAVRRAAFSPDGKLLVSVGEDSKVIVWDFERRERLKTFNDHTDWIASVAFSPDGKWFATASFDRTVIVWDAARLDKAAVLRGHREKVCAIAFSPDGRLLVSSGHQSESLKDGTALWRVGSWEKVGVIPRGAGEPQDLLFSSDSRRLIFHYNPHNTWDLTTGQPAPNEFDPAWGGNNAVFSPDRKRLVSVDSKGGVNFVDWLQRSSPIRYPAHQDNGRATAWSPDGRLVATGAENVILWDAVTTLKIASLEYSSIVWSLAFSPDGRWLVSTHGDGAVLVWDMDERRRAASFSEHSGPVRAVAFARDGKRIASASEDRSVIVWNAATGRKETTLVGHATRVSGLAFAPSGNGLASVDWDGSVSIWDLAQRPSRLKFDNPQEPIDTHCLAVSPDGRWVVVSQGVYESATGRHVVKFERYDAGSWQISAGGIYGISFSVDGQWMVLAEARGRLFLWDTATWQIVEQADIAPASLISVSFSPDGQWMATGEDQGLVRLWSASPLRQIAELGRHNARVKSVTFSPDGRKVVSASDDKTICLWDVSARKLVTRIGTHTSPVLSVAFSPDGKQIVSGEHDHSVRLYTRHRALWGWRWD
ncbi:MAG TPA: serine/threonine-protein kinase [Blastocatellia bacterium]|nr:serine/threonine-protein kinase [Blastocatellia bacterium]